MNEPVARKPSRYRSVQRQHAQAEARARRPETSPVDDREAAEAAKRKESIQRSMSRYRRPGRVNTANAASPVPELPRSPDIPHFHTTTPAPVDNPFEDPRVEARPPPRSERKLRQRKQEEKIGFLARLMGRKSSDDERVKTKFGTPNLSSSSSRRSSSRSHSAGPHGSNNGSKVRVSCGDHITEVPLNAEMKARDVMALAAEDLDMAIDPDEWTITEYFGPLHLERPLRRYECVRAVVVSWDNDSQNHLVMSRQDEENDLEADEFVEARFAPHKQPAEGSFHLYHASRNGKWDKRYITVRPDGQVTLSKKKKPVTSADSVNICHMSDFDVFSLTRREQKRVRPPKKFSFAVKSMQKSNMFEKNNNFVHYFSTKDHNMANDFYHAVHGWRSYYLVHVLGGPPGSRNGNSNGNTDSLAWNTLANYGHSRSRKNTVTSHDQHQVYQPRPSAESSARAIPAIPPIYNDPYEPIPDRTVTRGSNTPISRAHTVHRNKTPRSRPASPTKLFSSSYPHTTTLSRPASRDANPAPTATADDPFPPTSLLGRTYTQKQQHQQSLASRTPADPDTFAPHTLLAEISRRQSTRRGRSNTLRRPGTTTTNNSASASAAPSARASLENPIRSDSPFTPGGLLAGLSRAGSRSGPGPGPRSGPMLDFRGGQSQFAEGSLLRDVEERERGH